MVLSLEIRIEEPKWDSLHLNELLTATLPEIAAATGLKIGHIDLLACNDHEIQQLNQGFRDKAQATNVLSWPSQELANEQIGYAPYPPKNLEIDPHLGDIAIAYETCFSEASAENKPLADHACHLFIHGVLHLLGYNHIEDSDAEMMEALEIKILKRLSIANPYKRNTL